MTMWRKTFISGPNGPIELTKDDEDPTLIPELETAYGIDLDDWDPSEAPSNVIIDDYLREAMEETHVGSLRHLAEMLNIQPSTITDWRKGRSLPGRATMIRLADMSGNSKDEAMLYLQLWKAKTPDDKNIFITLLRLINTIKHGAEHGEWKHSYIPGLLLLTACYRGFSQFLPGFLASLLIILGISTTAVAEQTQGRESSETRQSVYYGKSEIIN